MLLVNGRARCVSTAPDMPTTNVPCLCVHGSPTLPFHLTVLVRWQLLSAVLMLHLRWLVHMFNFGGSKARETLLLDVGEFWSLKMGCLVAASTAETAKPETAAAWSLATRHSTRATSSVPGGSASRHSAMEGLPANAAAVAASTFCLHPGEQPGRQGGQDQGVLQLYSIVAWALRYRATTWTDGLNLKGGAQQLTRGYLEAPGTTWMCHSS
jgi:hypothetical protein